MIAEPLTEGGLLRDIAAHASVPAGEREWFGFAVLKRDDGTLVGLASLRAADDLRVEAEVGFELGEAYWGSGYGTEILGGLVAIGFKRIGFQRLVGDCLDSNVASQRVLEKNGFLYESEDEADGDRRVLRYGRMNEDY